MDHSLLYVSSRCRELAGFDDHLRDIVHESLARNAELGVTGALVATGDCFAQILEGPADTITELMSSIRRDPRHGDVTVLETIPIAGRSFPFWSMAYSGPASFVARQIEPLLHARGPEDRLRIRLLRTLIREFAKISEVTGR